MIPTRLTDQARTDLIAYVASLPATVYLAPKHVGAVMHVSPAKTYRIFKDPSFPATHLGGALRVQKRALEKWLAERTQGRRVTSMRPHIENGTGRAEAAQRERENGEVLPRVVELASKECSP